MVERLDGVYQLYGHDADDELGKKSLRDLLSDSGRTTSNAAPIGWLATLSFQGCIQVRALGAQNHFPFVAATPARNRQLGDREDDRKVEPSSPAGSARRYECLAWGAVGGNRVPV